MKIDSLKNLANGDLVTGAGTAPDGDFISRVNQAINNFKGLIEMAQNARGATTQEPPRPRVMTDTGPGPSPKALPPAPLPSLLDKAIAAGFGDITVNEIMSQLGPRTLKELKGVLDNVTGTGK